MKKHLFLIPFLLATLFLATPFLLGADNLPKDIDTNQVERKVETSIEKNNVEKNESDTIVNVYFFWGEGCGHCEKEKRFLEKLHTSHPNIEIFSFEIYKNKNNRKLLKDAAKRLQFSVTGLPVTIIGKSYFIGFTSEETTGQAIIEAIDSSSLNGDFDIMQELMNLSDHKLAEYTKGKYILPETVSLPLVGEIAIKNISLPLLTVILGAIDGFNPCAMWVLFILISFFLAAKDRKRMIILGTIFIFISALVYYLFMAAWLNLMLFFSYIPWIKMVIGILSIAGGGFYLKEFWTNKEGICKVSSVKQKKSFSEKLHALTQEKGFLLAVIGIIILAFSVNLIELICSAGLPAVYVQVLSLSQLSTLEYYLYLLLYVFIFMLDDLFVFLVAVFTLQMVNITTKYSRYSHLIGGSLLIIIGALLVFKPDWLMFGKLIP